MTSGMYSLPTVSVPTGETLNLFQLGTDVTEDAQTGLILYLTTAFRAGEFSLLGAVQTTLAILTSALPDMTSTLAMMKSLNIVVHTVSETHITEFLSEEPKRGNPLTLIEVGEGGSDECFPVLDRNTAFASAASFLMAIGKQGGTGPEAAAVNSRPKALIERFKIPERFRLVLPGQSLGPSLKNLDIIYQGFSTYSEPRATVVKYFLALSTHESHLPIHLEIMMTNFRLMRGAGMTHVEAINKLMNMHPWTVRVPDLAPYYSKYASELGLFSQIPLEVREYHRLLVPQSQYLFLTTEYRPLIAVAGSYMKEVESTFGGYVYNEAKYQKLISKVKSYDPSKVTFIGDGSLAAKLGIQDMTLPPITGASGVDQNPIV